MQMSQEHIDDEGADTEKVEYVRYKNIPGIICDTSHDFRKTTKSCSGKEVSTLPPSISIFLSSRSNHASVVDKCFNVARGRDS